jgi:hypothetical protein
MTTINEQKLEREEDTRKPAKPPRDPQGSRQRPPAQQGPAPGRPEVQDDEDSEDEEE